MIFQSFFGFVVFLPSFCFCNFLPSFKGVPGAFVPSGGVPEYSGSVPGCSGFNRHPAKCSYLMLI